MASNHTEQLSAWVRDLASAEYATREYAIRSLIELVEVTIPAESGISSKGTWPELVRAFSELGYPVNASAVPWLVERLMDVNWPGSQEAAAELARIGAPVVPHLRQVIRQHAADDWWMSGICRLLEMMEPSTTLPLVPELLYLLELGTDANELEAEVISLLSRIGSPYADAAIVHLARLASNSDRPELLRILAIDALREFSPQSVAVIKPYLISALTNSPDEIRSRTMTTLDWLELNQSEHSSLP